MAVNTVYKVSLAPLNSLILLIGHYDALEYSLHIFLTHYEQNCNFSVWFCFNVESCDHIYRVFHDLWTLVQEVIS